MQRDAAGEALNVPLGPAGGRSEAWIAITSDLALPEPSPRESADAPAEAHARSAFLMRRGFARRILARRLGCGVGDVEIGRDAAGAPFIAAPDCGLHLSISGRDDFVAVAIAARRIGVDIEPVGAPFDPPVNVLHAGERAVLAKLGDGAHHHVLPLWTAKEAYLKALGTGLSREPSDIETAFGAAAGGGQLWCADDIAVFDRGRRIALSACLVARLPYKRRWFVLACIELDA